MPLSAVAHLVSVSLLLLSLCRLQLASGQQQVGYQYIQSADGDAGTISLNLWGVLGGCGAGTFNELYVQSMSGSVLGVTVAYPLVLSQEQAPSFVPLTIGYAASGSPPSNCVSLDGVTLNTFGLGFLYSQSNGQAFVVSNNVSYVLTTYFHRGGTNFFELTSLTLSLQPPSLVRLMGASAGPSVGLLFNGGFEQTLAAASVNVSTDLAAGWTGNYMLLQYESGGTAPPAAAGLPGQSSTSQRQYASLSPGGVSACTGATLGGASCSSASLTQGSLPMFAGLQYSLSWYAACGPIGGVQEPCSFSVTRYFGVSAGQEFNPSFVTLTTVFNRTDSTWVQQSVLLDFNNITLVSTSISFTALTGNPLLDSVLLNYETINSLMSVPGVDPTTNFTDLWYGSGQGGFYNGSLFTASDEAYEYLVGSNSPAANITDYTSALPDGRPEVGALVHTYLNHSWAAVPFPNVQGGYFLAEGGRNYTFSLTANAFEAGEGATIALSWSFQLFTNLPFISGGGPSTTVPAKCAVATGAGTQCGVTNLPHTPSTRRRLLQTQALQSFTANSYTSYYDCSDPSYPCSNVLLSVTLSPPVYLALHYATIQLVVYNLDVALTNLQVTSVAFSLPDLAIDSSSGVVGDPAFTGLLGQRFQVHGVSGSVYALLTSARLHVNARFDFLNAGGAPLPHVVDTQPWTHPGTYLGAMSFQVRNSVNASHIDVLVVEAGEAGVGFAQVTINGQQLAAASRWQSSESDELAEVDSFAVHFVQSHVLELRTAQFRFRLVNSDRFINHEMAATVPLQQLACHGLLGQTASSKQHATALRYVEGEVDDYVVGVAADDDKALTSTDTAFNLFGSYV